MTATPPLLLALADGREVRPRKAPLNRPKESELHCDVAKLLADHLLPDWRHSHFPAGERRDVITGSRLKRMGLQPGWPDFLLLSPTGQLHCIELKRQGEDLSDSQENFWRFCVRARRPPFHLPHDRRGFDCVRQVALLADSDWRHAMKPFDPRDMDYYPPGTATETSWRNEEAKAPVFRRVINPADWEGLPIPPREWIVPGYYIPHKTVTLLGGDGSVGKSLLAMQLAAGRAIAREWIGLLPEPGRTLMLSAEDDADEMHRRLDDIRKFYGARMADLADIRLVDLVGEDSILGLLMKCQIEPAPMYHALDAYMSEFQPSLVVLDVLADMFSGDENSRPQSRQFIGLLKKLARKHDCAFLLLAHPSLTGMNSGTGTSGSTGWSIAVRSRLYFQTAKASDGSEPNKNLRTLECKKSNYGPADGQITLEWKNGLFVPVQAATGIDKMAADAKADEAFIAILKKITAQGRKCSPNPGPTFAAAQFASEPEAKQKGLSKAALASAMPRLLSSNIIHVETYGPASHQRSKLVLWGSNE